MEDRNDALERIRAAVNRAASSDARFISVVTVVGSVLRRVLSAEKTAFEAAISLAQQTRLEEMCSELSAMIEALGTLLPQHVSLDKVPARVRGHADPRGEH
jgi:hypothetical protein